MKNYIFFDILYILVTISSILGRRPNNHNTNSSTVNPISKFLSKFHQNDYKLVYERSELVRTDASLAKVEIRTFKFNRTTPLTNATFIYTVDFQYDLEVISQAYKFASNEYREFPMRFQVNFCEAITSKLFGLDMFSVNGNIVCPLVKDKKYFTYNFLPDESQFPPFVPNGRYLLEFQVLYHSKEVFVVNNYGTVDRPMAVPDI